MNWWSHTITLVGHTRLMGHTVYIPTITELCGEVRTRSGFSVASVEDFKHELSRVIADVTAK